MKANDICIGDWLNIYNFPNDNPKQDDLFPAKVSAVSVFDPFKDPDDVTVELVIPNTNGLASRPLDTCLPIELTDDILVKNGFDKDERSKYYHDYILELELWDFDISWSSVNGFRYEDIKLNYVHQLQHLLRLCGIEKELTI